MSYEIFTTLIIRHCAPYYDVIGCRDGELLGCDLAGMLVGYSS